MSDITPPTDDNIIQLPREEPPDLLVGPFQEWRVQVEGKIIPRLTGFREGDRVWLVVDHRHAASFSKEDAYGAATLIAQAMAIGEGYPWFGAETKDMPFAPIGHAIETLPKK